MVVYEIVLGAVSLCAIVSCARQSPRMKDFLY